MCRAVQYHTVLIGRDPATATPFPPHTAFGLKYEGAIDQPRKTTSLCNPPLLNLCCKFCFVLFTFALRIFLFASGPNMSGKSTYLRQVILLSIMGQVCDSCFYKISVLWIRDAYSGPRILIFTHPGSRIQKQQ